MARNALLGLTFAALCIVSPSAWGASASVGAGETAKWSELGWDETPAEGGEATVALGDGAALVFDEAPALAKLTVNGNGALSKADGVALAIPSFIVNGTPAEGSALPFDLQGAQYTNDQKDTDFSFFNVTETSGDYTLSGNLALGNRHWKMTGGDIVCARLLTNGNADGSLALGCSVFEMAGGTVTVTGKTATEGTVKQGDVTFALGGNYGKTAYSPISRVTLSGVGTAISVPDGTVSLSADGVLEGEVKDGARLSAYKMIGLDGMSTASRGGKASVLTVRDGGILALGKAGAADGLLRLRESSYPCLVRLGEGAILEANGDWAVKPHGTTDKALYFDGATTVRPNGHTITLGYLATASGAMSIEGTGTVVLDNNYVGSYTGAITVGEGTTLDLSDTGSGVKNAIAVNGTVRLGENGACNTSSATLTLGETGKVAFTLSAGTWSVELPTIFENLASTSQLSLTTPAGDPIDLAGVTLEGNTLTISQSAMPTYYGKGEAEKTLAWEAVEWATDADLANKVAYVPGTESDKAPAVILGNGGKGGTVSIGDGADLTLRRLVVNGIGTAQKTYVEQTGGTLRLTETGHCEVYGDGSQVPDALYIGLASGNSAASYTLKGGQALLPEGWAYVGGATWNSALNVEGGLFRARGIAGSSNQAFVFRQTGGVVALGEGGVRFPYLATKPTMNRTLTLGGGIMVAEADSVLDVTNAAKGSNATATIEGTMTLAALPGKTLSVTGPFTGTGALRIGSATLPTELEGVAEAAACTGTVDLSGATFATKSATLMGGTLALGTQRDWALTVPEDAAETAVTFRLTDAEKMGAVRLLASADGLDGANVRVEDAEGNVLTGSAAIDGDGGLTWTVAEGAQPIAFLVPDAWAAKTVPESGAFLPTAGGDTLCMATETAAKQTTSEGSVAYVGETVASPVEGKAAQAFGGLSQVAAGNLVGDLWLKVSGGDWNFICGGSDANNWTASAGAGQNKQQNIKGDILVNVVNASADYIVGGNFKDAKASVIEGDVAVVIGEGVTLRGSACGGPFASHGSVASVTGDTLLSVRGVLSSTATESIGKDGGITGSSCFYPGYLVGGFGWDKGTNTHTVGGDSGVEVMLGETAGTATFVKHLVGGGAVVGGHTGGSGAVYGNGYVSAVSGSSSVVVEAPDTVTFTGDIVGGGMAGTDLGAGLANNGAATVAGDASVTLDGGVYSGNVWAGGRGNAATVGGAATLTVGARGATFKGRVQGGVAASKALALNGTLTLDGGTLELASFDSVSGEGTVAVKAGTLDVGVQRASEGFGVMKVSEAAQGTIAVTWDPAAGDTVVLPLVGDGLKPGAFAVSTEEGAFVAVAAIEPAENATTLRMSSFVPPLKAADVAGEGLAWADLSWQGSDGEAAPADAVAAWTGGRTLELAGDASVTLSSAVSATPFAVQGTGTLTLSAAEGGKLTAGTVSVGTDAVLEAGAATLSDVTIAEGKTLTVRDTATLSLTAASAAKGSGTLRMEGVTVTRSARPASGEAMLEVGQDARLTLTEDGSSQIPVPLAVSGNGVLELKGKDLIGWNPSTAQLRNTRVVAREQGVVRKPSEVVESMRCTYEMGGASRLEVGKVKEKADGTYDAGFAMCRGARFIATDGAAGIYGLADADGAAIALRCTSTGAGIAGTDYAHAEFDVRLGATFTVDVPLRHYANGSDSDFPVRKTGAGTLVLTQANPTAGNPLHVEAGRVRLADGATWEDAVTLCGTLAAEGTTASVAALTLAEGAALDASAGTLSVTGAVTLADGVEAVPVALAEGAKAGDAVLACAEPTAEVAAALKAEGFTVAAVAGTGYVLASAEPTPKNPEAFDATTLAQLRKDAAAAGLTDGFTVEVRDPKEALVGREELTAAVLACFQGVTSAANPETNVLTYAYAFGVAAAKADVAEGTATVTVSVHGGAFRPGTMVQLVAADASAEVLASQTVPSAETPEGDLTLTVTIDRLTRPFKAKVVTSEREP